MTTNIRETSQTSELLVECEWLHRRLGDPHVRPVDLRDPDAFGPSHIPGAVRLDLAALGASRGACDNVLLAPSEFERLMASVGISSDDTVVAYDDQWGLAAARLLWALHHYEHTFAVVLNGGWDAWREGEWASTDSVPSEAQPAFTAGHTPEVVADREWISRRVGERGVVFLDTRTPAEFEQGHLPGALCWDWFNAVPAGGWNATRDPEDLRSEWAALGVRPTDEVVVYCRSGMRAAHTYLALKHAGFPRVRLYDGSWQDWSAAEGAER